MLNEKISSTLAKFSERPLYESVKVGISTLDDSIKVISTLPPAVHKLHIWYGEGFLEHKIEFLDPVEFGETMLFGPICKFSLPYTINEKNFCFEKPF